MSHFFGNLKNWFVTNQANLLRTLVCLVICVVIFYVIRWVLRLSPLQRFLTRHGVKPADVAGAGTSVSLLCLWLGLSSCLARFDLPTKLGKGADRFFRLLLALTMLAIVLKVITCLAEAFTHYLKQKNSESYGMNKLLLDLVKSLLHLLAWCGTAFLILEKVLNVDIAHLLVGVGVAGMAIAFAAQNTIANIFGAFAILGSKLFKVGDWIKVNDTEGSVENIGFRSVRLRAADGRVIDLPNRLIADSRVDNCSRRPYWREQFTFGLVYQTTPEQLNLALQILSDIGRDMADVMVKDKPVKFDFLNYADSSLLIDGFVWFAVPDGMTRRTVRSQFNQEVFKRFTEAGLSFAYPTTTVFLENKQ